MILRTLYLKLAERGLTVEYAYGFLLQSRCLCNYLEREVLKKIKFRSEGYNRIVVCLTSTPSPETFINSCQVLGVDALFKQSDYGSKQGDALMLYYIDVLTDGLRHCSQSNSIPFDELLQGIDDFKKIGMKNEWLFKSRTFREHSLKVDLLCRLTMEQFTLRLQVCRRKELVLDEIVLTTEPDEIAFEPMYKDIKIEDGALLITQRYGEPLVTRSLASIP